MKENKIAIITVAYNRVDSLQRLLVSLENANYGEEHPTLVISIDKSNTNKVEDFADNYRWSHGEKIVRKHDSNLGLRNHMMSLGEWFDTYDTLIVLEDDIVVSPNYYIYTRQTSDKYFGCNEVAGISLYSFAMNYQTHLPFVPEKNEYDVYFMNCAMSWGEVWMKPQWQDFYQWYLLNQDFPILPHLPECICGWTKSWLKYHTRYCIERNKYFVFPYISQSTNYSDLGIHNKGIKSSLFQVVLQDGCKLHYLLPDSSNSSIKYDGFFENKALYDALRLNEEDVCIDICGKKSNREGRRYWLTTKIVDHKIIKSFGLSCRPIEMNVLKNIPGKSIFLYDTKVVEKNSKENINDCFTYYTYQIDGYDFVSRYGWRLFFKECIVHLFNKIKGK